MNNPEKNQTEDDLERELRGGMVAVMLVAVIAGAVITLGCAVLAWHVSAWLYELVVAG